jgi:hypothetical protein
MPSSRLRCELDGLGFPQKPSRKKESNAQALQKKPAAKEKKSRAQALLQKLCRPYFPENLDLILIDGATLLVRARAPPETWTTKLGLAASLRLHW